jgi:hypothetical protein
MRAIPTDGLRSAQADLYRQRYEDVERSAPACERQHSGARVASNDTVPCTYYDGVEGERLNPTAQAMPWYLVYHIQPVRCVGGRRAYPS